VVGAGAAGVDAGYEGMCGRGGGLGEGLEDAFGHGGAACELVLEG
jgi:hypothetical protein